MQRLKLDKVYRINKYAQLEMGHFYPRLGKHGKDDKKYIRTVVLGRAVKC